MVDVRDLAELILRELWGEVGREVRARRSSKGVQT